MVEAEELLTHLPQFSLKQMICADVVVSVKGSDITPNAPFAELEASLRFIAATLKRNKHNK